MTKKAFAGLFLCALAGALVFRLARLDVRPVHPDEANQAVKFADLLERGDYRFDPRDHHGPTLYYLTLPAARLAGTRSLAALDETELRAVPALFGAGLLVLLLLFAGGLSREAILSAAFLAAVSPAMVYYSRFYIRIKAKDEPGVFSPGRVKTWPHSGPQRRARRKYLTMSMKSADVKATVRSPVRSAPGM